MASTCSRQISCFRPIAACVSATPYKTSNLYILCRRNFSISNIRCKIQKKIEAESFTRKEKHPLEWTKRLQDYLQEKRAEEENDEPPHMLHMAYRVHPLKGRPWWEKETMTKLGLDKECYKPVLLKNTPAVNEWLAEVKHLLVIQSVKFPHGIPKDKSDFQHTLLRMNGEMVVNKKLDLSEVPSNTAEVEESRDEKWKMKLDTLRKRAFRKIENRMIASEYYNAHYKYKFNQDGKEFRYKHNTGERNKRHRGHLQFPKKDY